MRNDLCMCVYVVCMSCVCALYDVVNVICVVCSCFVHVGFPYVVLYALCVCVLVFIMLSMVLV